MLYILLLLLFQVSLASRGTQKFLKKKTKNRLTFYAQFPLPFQEEKVGGRDVDSDHSERVHPSETLLAPTDTSAPLCGVPAPVPAHPHCNFFSVVSVAYGRHTSTHFLNNFSFAGICDSSVTVPNMLPNLFSVKMAIFFEDCMA